MVCLSKCIIKNVYFKGGKDCICYHSYICVPMNEADYIFRSARLGFRAWKPEDIPLLAAMNADPVVMEYFPKTYTYEETEAQVKRFNAHFLQYGYGFFAVDRLDTGSFIGFIGLNHASFAAFFTPCVEIGWRLTPSVWGAGFATEGAIRCLQFAFDELQLNEVFSFTALLNKRSEKVMQKTGMKKAGEFAHPLCRMNILCNFMWFTAAVHKNVLHDFAGFCMEQILLYAGIYYQQEESSKIKQLPYLSSQFVLTA